MNKGTALPPTLASSVGSETQDFAVFSKRSQPIGKSFKSILGGLFAVALSMAFILPELTALRAGEDVEILVNDVPVVANMDNLEPLLIPAVIVALVGLVGVALSIYGVMSLFRKGGHFVGTPTRLIQYYKGEVKSINWEQFSGNMTLRGDNTKGTVSLELRTGRMVEKNDREQFVPDMVYLIDIANALEVEKICRQRITEHDPTPANSVVA